MINAWRVPPPLRTGRDVEIQRLLAAVGLGGAPVAQAARQTLEAAGLTRSGKVRISTGKIEAVIACLQEQFVHICGSQICRDLAPGHMQPVIATDMSCDLCGGSEAERAALRIRSVMLSDRRSPVRAMLVGGAPSSTVELRALNLGPVELRTIFGDRTRPVSAVRADLNWADVLLVWSATEVAHKVSLPYVEHARAIDLPVVTCPRRGLAALIDELVGFLEHRGTATRGRRRG